MQISRIGPFVLEEPLDGLTYSNVLRGVHLEQKVSMAVKLLKRGIGNRPMGGNTFPDDVKQLTRLEHPGIVQCYGGAVQQGQPYLVLELVDGESLRSTLDRRGKLPWDAAVDLADEICVALQYAHAQGMVHQRLTPARVLITKEGNVKLTGFDCSWADRDEVLGLRPPMKVAHYLSPEQFRGKQSATLPTSDLFSLGVILYECLAGEVPWQARSPSELVQLRRASAAPHVSSQALDCPIWLDRFVSRLLATKRADRLQNAEQAHRAIVDAKRKVASGTGTSQQVWSGQQGVLAVDNDRSEVRNIQRAHRTKRRDESPFYERAWFLAFCLVALVGAGIWFMLPPGEDQLFEKALPLMQSERPTDWQRAKLLYLDSLRERFPDTKYAPQLKDFDERYAMHRAEMRMKKNQRLGQPAESEAERRYGEAWRFEQFGDRLTAWRKYEALVNLFAKDQDVDVQAYVRLARRQVERFKADDRPEQDLATYVQQHLERAQSKWEAGNLLEARRIVHSIVSLYDGNRELQPLVERARELLKQLDLAAGDIAE